MDLHARKLTRQDLRPILVDTTFRSGQFFSEYGEEINWNAVKLPNTRWTIYYRDSRTQVKKVMPDEGEILTDDKLIKKLVPCTQEVFELYWKGGEE